MTMPTLTTLVQAVNNQPMTDSRTVARVFGKKHFHVLRDIERLIVEAGFDFAKSNFDVCYEISVLQNGKRLKYYRMTKDGFTLLAMGFTGASAIRFKIGYINQFNAMAETLSAHKYGLSIRYASVSLEYQNLSDVLSNAGRVLCIGGKQHKPALRRELEELEKQIQPMLPFGNA